MTAQKTRNGFEFSCNGCGEVWEPPKLGFGLQARTFGESWELAKEDGWRAIKKRTRDPGDDEWFHACKDCR